MVHYRRLRNLGNPALQYSPAQLTPPLAQRTPMSILRWHRIWAPVRFLVSVVGLAVAMGWAAISAAQANTLQDELRQARQTLAETQALHGPTSAEMALAMRRLAAAHRQLNEHPQAIEWARKALDAHLSLFGPLHSETAESRRQLGNILSAGGRAQEALQVLREALEVQEQAHGVDDASNARLLNLLANASRLSGNPQGAVEFGRRAVDGLARLPAPDPIETATMQIALGNAYMALARYDEALPLLEQALSTYEARQGRDSPNTGRALSNVSGAYSRLGLHAKALPLRLRAVENAEKSRGAGQGDLVIHLNNLAFTHGALGQWAQAVQIHQRVLAMREATLSPDHPQLAVTLNNLSNALAAVGDHAAALPLQQRALAVRDKTLGPLHPETASSLFNLSVVQLALGQIDQALELAQRALAAYEATLGAQHPETAKVRAGLAELHRRQGHPGLAIALLKQTVNAQQAQRERVSRLGEETLRSYTDTVSGFYQQLASALSEEGRLPEAQLVLDMLKEEEQFEFVRRSAGSNPGRTRIGLQSAERWWVERYSELGGRLAAAGAELQALERQAREAGGPLDPAKQQRQTALRADQAVARAAFASFLSSMRAEFAARGPSRAADIAENGEQALKELRETMAGLGGQAVLLQLYLTQDRVNLLLTTPAVQLARSVAVSAGDLNRQIGEFRRLLRDPRSNPVPAAQALYRLLIGPVEQDLEQAGARTVMLWLDGTLRYLPFGALHDGKGYLVGRLNLPVYTSVARERLREPVSPSWRAAGLGVTRQIGEFEALPAVRAEMSSIIRAGGERGDTGSGVMPGEVHLDEAFTAQRLGDVARRAFPVVHLASHFRFSPGTEADSFLLLGDGKRLTLGDMRRQGVRFDQVDLLTLSACDTGLGGGRDERGQEIEGFGVMAQQQGARAVLATLWAVSDQSTAILMADTYRRREAQRLTKTEALRQAQWALAQQPRFAHPFYWAPFILMGNWK